MLVFLGIRIEGIDRSTGNSEEMLFTNKFKILCRRQSLQPKKNRVIVSEVFALIEYFARFTFGCANDQNIFIILVNVIALVLNCR
jgi:hypothetical protein